MPMLQDVAPTFSQRFPEAANIFNNLHMLHDNIDDVLASPELFPSIEAKRERIYQLLAIYLHRNHQPGDTRYARYRAPVGMEHHHGGHAGATVPAAPGQTPASGPPAEPDHRH
jgi:hypothetical protein